MLESLKRKDPPILTNDEIIAATEEVERLANFFKEDIAVAKVTKIIKCITNTTNEIMVLTVYY